MKKIIAILVIGSLLASCNLLGKKKKDLGTSLTEKIIEKASGDKVSIPNTDNFEKTKVNVDLDMEDEDLKSDFKSAKTNVVIQPDGIIITVFAGDENVSLKSLMITINKNNIAKASKPIHATHESDNDDPTFTLVSSSIGSDEMFGFTSQEGTLDMSKFNEDKIVIKLDTKVSTGSADESSWKDLKGTITIDYPVISGWGEKKKNVMY